MRQLFFDDFNDSILHEDKWDIHEWTDIDIEAKNQQLEFYKELGQFGMLVAKVNENKQFIDPTKDFKASYKIKINSNNVLNLVGFGFGEGTPEPIFLGTQELIEFISLGEISCPMMAIVDEGRNRAYVSRMYYNPQVVDLTTKSVIGEINSNADFFDLNTTNDRLYAGREYSQYINIINPNTYLSESEIYLPDGYAKWIKINNTTNKIYVAISNNKLVIVDGETNTIEETINLDYELRFMDINEDTNKLYATINQHVASEESKIVVINLNDNTIEAEIATESGMFGIAVNSETNKIYSTTMAISIEYGQPMTNHKVVVVNGITNEIEDTIDLSNIAYDLRGIAVNLNKVYVASYGIPGMFGIRGKVIVLDGETNEIIKSLDAIQGTVWIGINKTTNMVYAVNRSYIPSLTIIDGETDTGIINRYLWTYLYNGEWIICEYEYVSNTETFTKRWKFEGDEEWKFEQDMVWRGTNPLEFILLVVSFVGGQLPGDPTLIDTKFDDIDIWGSSADTSIVIKVVTEDAIQTLTNKTLTLPKINEDVQLTKTSTELNNSITQTEVNNSIDTHRTSEIHELDQPPASHDNTKHSIYFATQSDFNIHTSLPHAENVLSLPAADASNRGKIMTVLGNTGERDRTYICLKSDSDTYSWIEIVNGGV